ncbi:class I SAM-dependent methyltransferase [Geotalea uraniireducens]|uniref:Methyltransferase type 11 n=1 Tax=Geotalea uraniireducens (strain Rf4) TaxID=351605 RepID=A5G842_GEOUR|nr:class I SAM-dependent methyltransferase [Geotalea uraniireducens]ABQ27960.1 Methyltransferase type 11 [Geotalea uraniireducens Rf4]
MSDLELISCWCGSGELIPFSEHYNRCSQCNTLVSRFRKTEDFYKGGDSTDDLYGKEYWTKHVKKLGFPDIYERSRSDLTERSVYWLRSILQYKLPPARTLELGCAHGGSVYLQRQAGYDASGAEMSNWLCEFARTTFDVPMYCGGIEKIDVQPGTLDAVIFMDVLEHFPDPVQVLSRIVSTLKEDGIAVIQTPCWRSVAKTYHEMKADNEMFLLHLKEDEHLYLFNEDSVRLLLSRVGLTNVAFETPIFAYDMFIFAGKHPLTKHDKAEVSQTLMQDPYKRAILALLDTYNKLELCEEGAQTRIAELEMALGKLQSELLTTRQHERSLDKVLNSFTWRLTAPFRRICDKLRRDR